MATPTFSRILNRFGNLDDTRNQGATLGGGIQGPRDPFQFRRAAEVGIRVRRERRDQRAPSAPLGRGAFGFRDHPRVQERIREQEAIFGGRGGFGGGRGFGQLDKFRQAEISAMRRLLDLQFAGVRTELEGTIAQTELTRDFNIKKLDRAERNKQRDVLGDALSRGILDSGIFLEAEAEVATEAAENEAFEQTSAARLIGGLRSQISLLSAQKAAQAASERAQIERAYLLARLSS